MNDLFFENLVVGRGGLEPPPLSGLDPKSSAYTNSAIYPQRAEQYIAFRFEFQPMSFPQILSLDCV